jgi:hypothetical protein
MTNEADRIKMEESHVVAQAYWKDQSNDELGQRTYVTETTADGIVILTSRPTDEDNQRDKE